MFYVSRIVNFLNYLWFIFNLYQTFNIYSKSCLDRWIELKHLTVELIKRFKFKTFFQSVICNFN